MEARQSVCGPARWRTPGPRRSFAGTSTTVSPSATSRCATCRPMPWRPSAAQVRSGQHRPAAASPGSQRGQSRTGQFRTCSHRQEPDRRRQLVRIHSDDDAAHAALLAFVAGGPARRATLLRAKQAPLEPLPATVPGEDACHERATPRSVGSRKESVPPGTSANPARPAVSPSEQEADERTTVPVDTAEGGQVVRLAHLLRLNPPDGRSSHIEWQPEGHRRL
jgi:hypothetical protein